MGNQERYSKADMDISAWSHQTDAYLWHMNNGEIDFPKRNIFLAEKTEIAAFNMGGPRFVVMVYNYHNQRQHLIFTRFVDIIARFGGHFFFVHR